MDPELLQGAFEELRRAYDVVWLHVIMLCMRASRPQAAPAVQIMAVFDYFACDGVGDVGEMGALHEILHLI